MTILITGSNGLLGQKIIYALLGKNNIRVIATSKGPNRTFAKDGYIYEEMDITDVNRIEELFAKYKPDCIINTAAMTNVDQCEKEKEECKKMNVDAVEYFMNACKKFNTHMVHLSTDFVFDGESGPYKEDDTPNPLSYYAWSKLESERVLESSTTGWAIIRTIIIYGVVDDCQRSNVVLWTKDSLEQKKQINVISDQYRSPTLAEDLAEACVQAAIKKVTGIYHVSGSEIMSILETVSIVADFFELDKSYIKPITSISLNQPAKRPPVTGFIIDKAKKDLNFKPHTFLQGLQIVKEQLQSKKQL